MRLAGKIKMGYYRTPDEVADRIKSFFIFPEVPATILDPCCGEGLALQRFCQDTNSISYGIELDGHRADEAKGRLHEVLKCGYEQTRISNGVFSILYLNPPYDDTVADSNFLGNSTTERKEKVFLRDTIKYLKPDGVLVYLIPQSRLRQDIAKIIAYRFKDVRVYRFPGELFEDFGQLVLFGVRKEKNSHDEELTLKLSEVPNTELQDLPLLKSPAYQIPAGKYVSLFASTVVDEEALALELNSSSLWTRFNELALVNETELQSPPLPLHKGHLGLLLASGCLDGVFGEGEEKHIVKGKVEKVVSKFTEYEENVVIDRELESFKVSIKILKRTGEITTLV